MDVLQNMMLFSELVKCGGNVYTWCYDAQGKLLRSNCPDEAFLASAFELFGCWSMGIGTMYPLPWERHWVFCGAQPLKRKRKN
mgnify:CR=1 FL=1